VTEYPPHWEADVVLSDGSTAHIRPIVPADGERIVALHGRLSERTRYLRYFGPYPRIPPRDLEHFTHVDHIDRVALVAELGRALIAVCRYDRIAGSDDAEVAFVVEDAHQGHGLGSVLLEHLAAAARERGIRRFVAEVLAENPRMARVFLDAGYQAERSFEGGVVHLVFPIEPTARSMAVVYEREQRAEARSIERMLTPRSVAVVGASADEQKLGHVLLANLAASKFAGEVFAVNPRQQQILNVGTYSRVLDIPQPVDLAVLAIPRDQVPVVAAECAEKGVRALVVVSAGFAERDEPGRRAEAELVNSARQNGMRVVGPNCLGILNTDPAIALNATLAPVVVPRGPIGFFCQSGALGSVTLQAVLARGMGLSTFVSAGNRADVSGNDLLQYWAEDTATDVVLMWLESFGNPRKFARLARRVARRKPVALLGRGPWSGIDAPGLQRLFDELGLIRVDTLAQLFDVGMLLGYQPLPAGGSVAIVGNSDALGVLAADACSGAGLAVRPDYPVNLGPDASPEILASVLDVALADPEVDSVVVAFVPALPSAGNDHAAAIVAAAAAHDKPMVSTFLGIEGFAAGLACRSGDGALTRGSVPSYPSPERAVHALARATRYAQWRARPVGTVPELTGIDRASATTFISRVLPDSRQLRDEETANLLLCYGIPVLPRRLVSTMEDVLRAADEVGYPVALKPVDGPLRHRPDLGGVMLDIADADEMRAAYSGRMSAGVQAVQAMAPDGVPVTIVVTDDQMFGALISFGIGGVTSELLGDRAYATVPMTDLDAARLVRAPRAAPLLSGYRGAEAVNLAALEQLLLRVARLADDHPEVLTVELDPILVGRESLTVLGATMTVGQATARANPGPRRLRPAQ
jgi:acyl-CoA synthetase (NDP forming)/RimJ/RimL family protein N-acetyltransferase